jgi:outer membrane protein OmpA-like peptidoglycan-associated protein
MAKSSCLQALCAGAFACCFTATAAAEPAAGTPVSFLACPIARDTGPEADLCFFAEYGGVRYGLANPPDWGSPQLKHRVLVEGRVNGGAAVCGAIAIEGRASVLPEIDESCNGFTPYDGVVKGAAGGVFNSGTLEQRAFAADLARRAAADPRLSVAPAITDPPAPPPPRAPFEARSLVITYPFNSDRGPGPDMVALLRLADYARISKARRISVVGYVASSRLSNGEEMKESASMAQRRAEKIAGILTGVGVPAKTLQVRWESQPIAGKGEDDWRNRKVELSLRP